MSYIGWQNACEHNLRLGTTMIEISPADSADFEEIWALFHTMVKQGDTYVYAPNTSRTEAYTLWMTEPEQTFVALDDDDLVGTYILKKNQPGLGSHVASAEFIIAPALRHHGVGKLLCQHAIEQARTAGYKAMQFNFIVSSDEKTIRMWQSLGFNIVGTVPQAFHHQSLGYIDAHIMYQWIAE